MIMMPKLKIYHTENKTQHIKDFIRQFQEQNTDKKSLLKPILFLFGASGTGKYTVVKSFLDKAGFNVKYLSSSFDYKNEEVESSDNPKKDCLLYKALSVSARQQWEKYAIILREIDSISILKSSFMISVLKNYQAEVDRRERLNPIIFILDSSIYQCNQIIFKSNIHCKLLYNIRILTSIGQIDNDITQRYLQQFRINYQRSCEKGSSKFFIFLKKIADQVNGDIRSALNLLTLYTYDQTSKKELNTKDNCLGLYHSLGKILYNKRKDKKTGEIREMSRTEIKEGAYYFNFREITRKLQCQQNIIRAFLFENYLPFFYEIDEVQRYTQILQECDILQNSLLWNEKSIALKEDLDNFMTDLQVQGYMENNISIQKVKKRFMYFNKPSLFIKRREQKNNQNTLAKAFSLVPSKERGGCLKLFLSIQKMESQQTQLIQSQVRSKGKSKLSVNAMIVSNFDEDEQSIQVCCILDYSIQQLLQDEQQLDFAKQIQMTQVSQVEVLDDILVQKDCKYLIPPRGRKQSKLTAEQIKEIEDLIG